MWISKVFNNFGVYYNDRYYAFQIIVLNNNLYCIIKMYNHWQFVIYIFYIMFLVVPRCCKAGKMSNANMKEH